MRSENIASSLVRLAAQVHTRDALSCFVRTLREQWERAPEQWCDATLDAALDEVEPWVEALDRYDGDVQQRVPDAPSWSALAMRLLAAHRRADTRVRQGSIASEETREPSQGRTSCSTI